MGTTRQAVKNVYKACKTCIFNNPGYGKCKKGFDNFYERKTKKNGCEKCNTKKVN